jgi:hypothetical protein
MYPSQQPEHPDTKISSNFMLYRPTPTIIPKHDFVVRVATALQFPARRSAVGTLRLARRAVEIVVVPDVDVHGVVESARAPHVRVHANARLRTGRH